MTSRALIRAEPQLERNFGHEQAQVRYTGEKMQGLPSRSLQTPSLPGKPSSYRAALGHPKPPTHGVELETGILAQLSGQLSFILLKAYSQSLSHVDYKFMILLR